jgi:hypothetical protein
MPPSGIAIGKLLERQIDAAQRREASTPTRDAVREA